MDDNRKPLYLTLASIGIPFATPGELDVGILPEKALCLASPLFYKDAKASALVYTLLKHNFDLFVDGILAAEIGKISDRLASAMLGGILLKANKDYFQQSIKACKKASPEDNQKLSPSCTILSKHGGIPYDPKLKEFGVVANEISEVAQKKTTPREYLKFKNRFFRRRLNLIEIRKNILTLPYTVSESDFNNLVDSGESEDLRLAVSFANTFWSILNSKILNKKLRTLPRNRQEHFHSALLYLYKSQSALQNNEKFKKWMTESLLGIHKGENPKLKKINIISYNQELSDIDRLKFEFAAKIKEYKFLSGLNNKELEEKLGASHVVLSKILNNKFQRISVETLALICAAAEAS